MSDERLAYVALGCLVEPGNRELGQLVRRAGPVTALELLCRGAVSDRLAGVAAVRLGGTPSIEAAHQTAEAMVERAIGWAHASSCRPTMSGPTNSPIWRGSAASKLINLSNGTPTHRCAYGVGARTGSTRLSSAR